LAVDTSVAVPLAVWNHPDHQLVMDWAANRDLWLSGHAAAETYSVLTRLPAELALSPQDAAEVIRRSFAGVLGLSSKAFERAHLRFATLGIAGGAVYDALVALAAEEHGALLVTRDMRALSTYDALGTLTETLHLGGTPKGGGRTEGGTL
jgi:predicted nucleic acid-binding protein